MCLLEASFPTILGQLHGNLKIVMCLVVQFFLVVGYVFTGLALKNQNKPVQ